MREERIDRNGAMEELGRMKTARSKKTAVLESKRVQQIREDYTKVCKLVDDRDAVVSCLMHIPFDYSGSIIIEADDLIFCNSKELAEVISRADNVEVYPMTKGKIRMSLNYTDLVKYED